MDTVELATVSEQAEIPDFHKALREDMKEEPAHEFDSSDRHGLGLSAIPVILVRKRDGISCFIVGNDPAVGDADPVSVTRKVFDDVARTVVWLFQETEELGIVKG